MGRVVINTDFGGFSLSKVAKDWIRKHGKEPYDIPRHDSVLIKCIETLGNLANGNYAELEVVEFEGNKYRIREYDGLETVETPNSINWITI